MFFERAKVRKPLFHSEPEHIATSNYLFIQISAIFFGFAEIKNFLTAKTQYLQRDLSTRG
jgi:hypothetical protein